MPRLEKTIEAVFADRDIMPDEVVILLNFLH